MATESSAVCYNQISTPQKEDGMKLLEQISPERGHQILDLGCGTGYLANVLAEKVGPHGMVVAVDPDGERIKMARESYGSNSNLKFLVASDKDFPEGEYDIVLAANVLHWIEDQDAVFKRVYKNLKPGGHFGFTTPDDPPIPEVLTEILELFGPQTVEATLGSAHWLSAAECEHLATSNGFEVLHMEVENQSFTFPNIDAIINFLYGVFHGKFERSSPLLDDLKRKYEGQQLVMDTRRLTTVLKKPSVSL